MARASTGWPRSSRAAATEWCGPCKSIAPILDEVAKEYTGRLKIAKINVDENQSVPAKFGIRGIPTLMLFRDGVMLFRHSGALPPAALEDLLKQAKTVDMEKVKAEMASHTHGPGCNHDHGSGSDDGHGHGHGHDH